MHATAATTAPALQHRAQLEAHLRGVLEAQLERLHKNWRFREAASPAKAVHDLRVATRRLRAFSDIIEHALGPTAAKRFERRLRRVSRALSGLRNVDVLTDRVEQRFGATRSAVDRAALEHLLEIFADQRAATERKARKRLAAIDEVALTADVVSTFEEAIERHARTEVPLDRFARALVARRTHAAIDLARHKERVERAEQWHELRIAVKKLRYVLELFEPVLDASGAQCHARTLTVQDLLGEHHDLVVLSDQVERVTKGLRDRKRRALPAGLAKLAMKLRVERARAIARYKKAEKFESARSSA